MSTPYTRGIRPVLPDSLPFYVERELDRIAIVLAQIAGLAERLPKVPPPASASAPGEPGAIGWDDNHIYVCVAQNTWKRSPLTAW